MKLFRRKPKCKHEYVSPVAEAPRPLTGIEKHWAEVAARELQAAREAEDARVAPLHSRIAKLKTLLAAAERELHGETGYARMQIAALQQNAVNPMAGIWNMAFDSNPYKAAFSGLVSGFGKL